MAHHSIRGFCTNVFGASSIDELVGKILPSCQRLLEKRQGDWALDLHLDLDVLAELENPMRGQVLAKALGMLGLKVASLNLYPLCHFQEGVVKEAVYRPDWWDPSRAELTLVGARWLAKHGHGPRLTISTLAGRFHPDGRASEEDFGSLAGIYAQMAGELSKLSTPGRSLVLAPEPEPFTTLQTVADVIALWQALPDDPTVRRHLGICLDACHFSVMGEDPAEAWSTLGRHQVPVAKIQASSALKVLNPARAELKSALLSMAEPRFLHQASVLSSKGRRFFSDLPRALADLGADDRELVCHYHMPLFLESWGVEGLGTTSVATRRLLKQTTEDNASVPVFAETYTWSVLGRQFAENPEAGLSRELDWLESA